VGPLWTRAAAEAVLAILASVTDAARPDGRDIADLTDTVDSYRRALELGDGEGEARTRGAVRAEVRRIAGARRAGAVGVASLGVAAAAGAALTWRLTTPEGAYTNRQRRVLISPWLTIAPSPPLLSQAG